jgi:hypothetical protein
MKTRSRIVLTGFCLSTLMAVAQTAQGQPPTLADIARQKRAEKAKKVFTSEDMKAAEPEAPAPAATEAAASEAKPAAPQSSEAVAAAEAKVADLRDREILLNKNIARFETSLAQATQEGNEDRAKSYGESLESAKASLAATSEQLKTAEKDLADMRAAAAAAGARKKPAKKPAAPAPQS